MNPTASSKAPWQSIATILLSVCGLGGTIIAAWMTIASNQAVQSARHEALVERTTKLESEQAEIKRDIKLELKEIRQLLADMQRSPSR